MPESNKLNYEFLIKIMDRLEFFSRFNLLQKQELVQFHKHFSVYEEGEYLITEGDSDSFFFIILSGKVLIAKGDEKKPLAKLEPGEFFGEISFLTKAPRTASAIAVEQSIVIKVSEYALKQMDVDLREMIKDRIIEKLVKRLDHMNSLLTENIMVDYYTSLLWS